MNLSIASIDLIELKCLHLNLKHYSKPFNDFKSIKKPTINSCKIQKSYSKEMRNLCDFKQKLKISEKSIFFEKQNNLKVNGE